MSGELRSGRAVKTVLRADVHAQNFSNLILQSVCGSGPQRTRVCHLTNAMRGLVRVAHNAW
jgi:hypothetical protein